MQVSKEEEAINDREGKVGLVTDGGQDIKGFGKQRKSPVPGSQECYPRVTTALGLLRKTIRV